MSEKNDMVCGICGCCKSSKFVMIGKGGEKGLETEIKIWYDEEGKSHAKLHFKGGLALVHWCPNCEIEPPEE